MKADKEVPSLLLPDGESRLWVSLCVPGNLEGFETHCWFWQKKPLLALRVKQFTHITFGLKIAAEMKTAREWPKICLYWSPCTAEAEPLRPGRGVTLGSLEWLSHKIPTSTLRIQAGSIHSSRLSLFYAQKVPLLMALVTTPSRATGHLFSDGQERWCLSPAGSMPASHGEVSWSEIVPIPILTSVSQPPPLPFSLVHSF